MTKANQASPVHIHIVEAVVALGGVDQTVDPAHVWDRVRPLLPSAEAGRYYLKRYPKKGEALSETERIRLGRRLMFEDVVKELLKRENLLEDEGDLRLGPEQLYTYKGDDELKVGDEPVARPKPALQPYVIGQANAESAVQDAKIASQKIFTSGDFDSLFPDLSDDEYDSLVRSIKAHGFIKTFPIYVDADNHSVVLDGRHRRRAALSLGIPESEIPIEYVHGSSLDKLRIAVVANLTRRHLKPNDVKAVTNKLVRLGNKWPAVEDMLALKRSSSDQNYLAARQAYSKSRTDQGASTREIGAEVGVHHSTIAEDLNKSVGSEPQNPTELSDKSDNGYEPPKELPSDPEPEQEPEPQKRRQFRIEEAKLLDVDYVDDLLHRILPDPTRIELKRRWCLSPD